MSRELEGGAGMKTPPAALYHVVYENESCQDAKQILIDMVRGAQAKHPEKPRSLFLDIDGHRNSAGGWDSEAEELQYWVIGRLLPYLTLASTPLVKVENSKDQQDTIPAISTDRVKTPRELVKDEERRLTAETFTVGRGVKFTRFDGKEGADLSHWGVAASFPEWRKTDMSWGAKKSVGSYYIRDLGEGEGDTISAGPWTLSERPRVMVVLGEDGATVRVPCSKSTRSSGTLTPFWAPYVTEETTERPTKDHKPGTLLVVDKQVRVQWDPSTSSQQGAWALPRSKRSTFAKHVGATLKVSEPFQCVACGDPFEEFSPTLRVVHWAPDGDHGREAVAGFAHIGCQDENTQIDSFTAFFDRSKSDDLRAKVILEATAKAASFFEKYSGWGKPSRATVEHGLGLGVTLEDYEDGQADSDIEPFTKVTSGRGMLEAWDVLWPFMRSSSAKLVIRSAVREIARDSTRFGLNEETSQLEFDAPPGFDEVAEGAEFDLDSFIKDAIASGLRADAGLCGICDEKIKLGEFAWRPDPEDPSSLSHCACADVPAMSAEEILCSHGTLADWESATDKDREQHWTAAAVVLTMQIFGDTASMSGKVSDDAGFDPGHPARFLDKTMESRSKRRLLYRNIGLDRFGHALTSEEIYPIFKAFCEGSHPWACAECGVRFAAEGPDYEAVPTLDWSCPECNDWPKGLPPEGSRVRVLESSHYAVVESSGTDDELEAQRFASEREAELDRGGMEPPPVGSVGIAFEAYQADGIDSAGDPCHGPFTGHVVVAFPKKDQPMRGGVNLHNERYNMLWRGHAMQASAIEVLDTPCTKSSGCWGGYVCSKHQRAYRPAHSLGIRQAPSDPLYYSIILHKKAESTRWKVEAE